MTKQNTYIAWDYGQLPCDNPQCRRCAFFSWNTVSCDYYLRTYQHKSGQPGCCSVFRARNCVSARKYRQMLEMKKVKS